MYDSKPKKPEEAQQELGQELADVIFAVVCLANTHKIDLNIELQMVISKAQTRDKDRFKLKT